MGILGLVDQEVSQEQCKVNLLWESNAAIPPSEPFHYHPETESDGSHLLAREKVCVLVAGRAKVFIRIQQDTESEYLED